jgi:hypothetical protein
MDMVSQEEVARINRMIRLNRENNRPIPMWVMTMILSVFVVISVFEFEHLVLFFFIFCGWLTALGASIYFAIRSNRGRK